MPTPTVDLTAPGHPDHRDHRQNLSDPLPPPVNQSAPSRRRASLSESDEAMLDQLRGQVRGLDQQANKGWDDRSERLAASALVMAKQMGASDDLRLGLNKPTEKHGGGTLLHLTRGGSSASPDPAANRAVMPTAEALSVPAEERYSQVQAIGLGQAEAKQLAQQQELARMNDPTQSGPKLSV